MKDLEQYAKDRLAELMHGKTEEADELKSEADNLDEFYDGDSFAPYHNQKQEVIDEYEREFGNDAEDFDGGQTFKASEYLEAMGAYSDAIGSCAFSSYFSDAKSEFSDAVDDMETEIGSRDLENVKISVHSSDPYGWSAHDREEESASGHTLCLHVRQQLDGLNGISLRVWRGLYLAFTWAPENED